MAVPANFPIFASLPTGLNPLSLFDTAFGMILNGSAPVPVGSIVIGTTTVGGGTTGQVLYNNNGIVGNTNQPVLNLASSTGLPVATGVSGLGAGIATFLATPTSANLAAALTDETGSGAAVFANSPALAGVPTAPTAAAATSTTQIATTAFVQGGYLPLPGGTLSGNLTITKATPDITLNVNAGANYRTLTGKTGGLQRWVFVLGDNVAESGGNAGSNLTVNSYDDTGVYIDTPISITRAAGGKLTTPRPVYANSGVALDATATSPANGQLAFPATQNPSADANTFDDYEEGTFTPAFTSTGSTFSYTSQLGLYTKIGNRVLFDVQITLNTSGNTLSTNTVNVSGLPFTVGGSFNRVCAPSDWLNTTTSYSLVQAVSLFGTSTLLMQASAAAATAIVSPAANALLSATAGSRFRFAGQYGV